LLTEATRGSVDQTRGVFMSDILNRAKAQYRDKLNRSVRVVEVSEWGTEDKPLKIFVKPANLAVRDKIYKFAANGSLEALVEAIILRAMDEDGSPLFDQSQKREFMTSVDPDIIARVAASISEDLDLTGESDIKEAAKN
jgi:hypothetical protein